MNYNNSARESPIRRKREYDRVQRKFPDIFADGSTRGINGEQTTDRTRRTCFSDPFLRESFKRSPRVPITTFALFYGRPLCFKFDLNRNQSNCFKRSLGLPLRSAAEYRGSFSYVYTLHRIIIIHCHCPYVTSPPVYARKEASARYVNTHY